MVNQNHNLQIVGVFASLLLADGQFSSSVPASPCPAVFSYDSVSSTQGQWYGGLKISTNVRLYGVWIEVILDKRADSLSSSFGEVTSSDNLSFKIENKLQNINPGTHLQITISVIYNSYYLAPKVQMLRLNGQEICPSVTHAVQPVLPVRSKPGRGNINRDDGDRGILTRDSGRDNSDERDNPGRASQENSNTAIVYPSSSGNGESVYAQNSARDRTTESPGRRNINKDSPVGENSGERESSYSLSLVPSVSHSYSQTSDPYGSSGSGNQGRTPTSRPPNRESPIQRSTITPSEQYPTSRLSGNGNSGQSSTKFIPLSPNTSSERGRSSSSRRPHMTSTSSQTHGVQPNASHDDNTDDGDNVDVEFSTTRKSARGGSSSSSNDYFQGDHRIPEEAKIHPTPPQSRPRSRQESESDSQSCGKVALQAAPLIVNGLLAKQGQWPWHVAIYQSQTVDSKYICGGSLVSLSHVLSAAHCVTRTGTSNTVNVLTLTVHLGKFNLRKASDGVQIMFVRKIFVHPEYNASNFYADLAVLKFGKKADYSNVVRPICLWQESDVDLARVIGREGSVVGWGFDENNRLQEELAMVRMPVVEQLTCLWSFKEFFSHFTSNHSFCAGYANGSSVCNGDSGGGMVFPETSHSGGTNTWRLRGVVSISVAKQSGSVCDPNHYVVFTDAAQFLPWIKQKMER